MGAEQTPFHKKQHRADAKDAGNEASRAKPGEETA